MGIVDRFLRAKRQRQVMRKLGALFITVLVLVGLGMASVDARGGRGSADCPAGSKDPDCQ